MTGGLGAPFRQDVRGTGYSAERLEEEFAGRGVFSSVLENILRYRQLVAPTKRNVAWHLRKTRRKNDLPPDKLLRGAFRTNVL